jgi:hypothetical protein
MPTQPPRPYAPTRWPARTGVARGRPFWGRATSKHRTVRKTAESMVGMTPVRRTDEQSVSSLPAPSLEPYSASQIEFAAAAWPMRAAEELRSALIYRALARASVDCGLAAAWVARIKGTVKDEIGHARLAVEVGERLGAARPKYDSSPVRRRLAGLPDLHQRALALLLVEVAMGETISMALFRAGRRDAIEPLTRAALHRIVGDEVQHQRLGWSMLTDWWPRLTDDRRQAMQDEARRGLAAMEQQIAVPALRRLESNEPFDPAWAALGVLAPEARVEAFYDAVERMVVPRLTRLGLDGGGAWRGRYRDPNSV